MQHNVKQFQTHLLRWFDKHGRKHLPWQENKTPYRVWISEIMLQQTQVNTVIPYFLRFMQRFPDLISLANAEQDDVLHLWAGLGYYSRARNLHHAAKMIMQDFKGQLPDTLDALKQLPGIGESTAGAILAIAFNQQATILDGNVKRVLARFHGITDFVNDKLVENKLWELATHYTPKKRVADYTQAMMDLGATLCIRGQPNCEKCPLIKNCIAHEKKITASLPRKKAARALPIRTATFIVLKWQESILLQKRPNKGIWGGLWSLPELEGEPEKSRVQLFCHDQLHLRIHQYQLLETFRHTFTHYHLDIFPVLILVKKKPSRLMEESQQIWYNPHHPETIGLPKPIQSIVRHLS